MISFCDSHFFGHFNGQAQRMSAFISRTNFKIKKHSNFLRAHKNLTNTKDGKKVDPPKKPDLNKQRQKVAFVEWEKTGWERKGEIRGRGYFLAHRSAVPGSAFARPVALD